MQRPDGDRPDLTVVRLCELRPGQPPLISSRDLLRHGPELLIEHCGQVYRLRLTREHKLILTK